jgi:hypothetical protein
MGICRKFSGWTSISHYGSNESFVEGHCSNLSYKSSLYSLRTDNRESTSHVIAAQWVYWRADCCLRKNTSRDSYPLLRWRHCTCAEVCFSSRCLETGYITPLFYCCLLDRVFEVVAWQCIDQIRCNIISTDNWRRSQFHGVLSVMETSGSLLCAQETTISHYSERVDHQCRDSIVVIATGYGLDYRGVGVGVPLWSRIFSSPQGPANPPPS